MSGIRIPLALVASLLLAGLATLSALSAQACPNSCLRLPGNVEYCTPAATLDTTLVDSGCCFCHEFRSAFNVPLGTIHASGSSSWDGCEARIALEDDFVVEGLPLGTPVALTAVFALTLEASSLMGPGFASASMTEGVSNTVALNWDDSFYAYPPGERDTVLTIPVSAISGTPFRMRYFVRAFAGELTYAAWNGTFDFTGLPKGAAVTSCKGFGEKPVPARPTSWGRLKTTYH